MKYFVISDVHSYFTPLREALKQAGFNKRNKNHTLVLCGDLFDRGHEAVKLYEWIRSIPKKRRILIRGNHEMLLKNLVERGYFCKHDIFNGTLDTVHQFTEYSYGDCILVPGQVLEDFNNLGVLQWIFSKEWVNYWEYKDYIFVHSWIPLIALDDLPHHIIESRKFKFNPNWRESTDSEWEDAMWGCPYKLLQQKLYPDGKVIVCGHWHARDFHKHIEGKLEVDNSIFFSKNCIALDACTAMSDECNVLVIDEDGSCYDKCGNNLGNI